MSEKKEFDFTGDEHWGVGGTYVVDPATGKRSPAPPAVDEPAAEPAADPAADPDPSAGAAADTKTTLKEKRRA